MPYRGCAGGGRERGRGRGIPLGEGAGSFVAPEHGLQGTAGVRVGGRVGVGVGVGGGGKWELEGWGLIGVGGHGQVVE